jgi:hypothetical protein
LSLGKTGFDDRQLAEQVAPSRRTCLPLTPCPE